MRKLIIISTLLLLSLTGFSQVDLLLFNEADADSLRKNYGRYSALDPIAAPDGRWFLPDRVLYHKDITLDSALNDSVNVTYHAAPIINDLTQDTSSIRKIPEFAEPCFEGQYYQIEVDIDNSEYASNIVLCRQTHFRTEHDVKDIPALFTFFRTDNDSLEWIEGELVKPGKWRTWLTIRYEMIQPGEILTVTGQTPDVTAALWLAEVIQCAPWVQPTGGHDAYQTDDCVTFQGNTYESLINANVWSPAVYPAGWQIQ